MKKKETTKIIIHNTTNNEIIIVGDRTVLGNYLNISQHTIRNWFRESKIVRKEISGCLYILYKADLYIQSGVRNKAGGFKK